jgi:hypothetical protein
VRRGARAQAAQSIEEGARVLPTITTAADAERSQAADCVAEPGRPHGSYSKGDPPPAHVDRVGIEERPAVLGKRSIKTTAKYEEAVRDALGRLDAVTELKTAWDPVGA